MILAGAGTLLWPLALTMLASVLVAFGAANAYVLALVTRQPQARGLLLSSLGLALLELAALSSLRTWLVSAFGFTLGV